MFTIAGHRQRLQDGSLIGWFSSIWINIEQISKPLGTEQGLRSPPTAGRGELGLNRPGTLVV